MQIIDLNDDGSHCDLTIFITSNYYVNYTTSAAQAYGSERVIISDFF